MDSVKAAASFFFFFSWFLVSGLVKCMYRSRLASTKNFEVVLVGRCEQKGEFAALTESSRARPQLRQRDSKSGPDP